MKYAFALLSAILLGWFVYIMNPEYHFRFDFEFGGPAPAAPPPPETQPIVCL